MQAVTTIKDVAKRAGVSPVTVSRVVNDTAYVSQGTREKVKQAIRELGYVPNLTARSLRSKLTYTLGLLLPDISNPFWTTVARGVEDSAQSRGYSVFVCNTDETPAKQDRCVSLVLGQQVDGVVIAPCDSDAKKLSALRQQNIPLVVVDRRIQGWDVDTVYADTISGSRALVEHLIQLGHRRIAVLSGAFNTSTAEDRVAGYCMALKQGGIDIDSALIKRGDFRSGSGEHLTLQLLDGEAKPTAILAANKDIARGVLLALEKRGLRVPQDMALVCVDDFTDGADLFPFLTVVVQPAYEMGTHAAQLLFSRLDNETALPARQVVLPTRMVLRYSCGRQLEAGDQSLSLPLRQTEKTPGILVKPLSTEEQQDIDGCFGSDLSIAPWTLRPPGYDKSDIERLLKVLNHQEADRLPHLELWVTSQSVYEYVLGRELSQDIEDTRIEGQPVCPEDDVAFASRLGMDAVGCNFSWTPNQIFEQASDGSQQPVGGTIKSWADLDNLEPPPSLADQLDYLERYLRAAQGTGVGVYANFSSFFNNAMRAVGVIDSLYLLYDDRRFLETLMDLLLDHQQRVMRAVCDRFASDLAFVFVNDEIANNVGLMIRPDMFEEIYPDRMQRLIGPAREYSKLTGLHTRGKMDKILPILDQIGFDMVHPVEPEYNDIFELKETWAGKMALMGGVPSSLLAYGNWDSIEQTVKEYCQRLAPGGGYVLGSSSYIMDGIPPANFSALVEAGHRYGSYRSFT